MDHKELRIDNWVRTKQTKKEFQLESISKDVSPSNYEGIPLTKDWLLKFGFEEFCCGKNTPISEYLEGSVCKKIYDDTYGATRYLSYLTSNGLIDTEVFFEQFYIDKEGNLTVDQISFFTMTVHRLQNLHFELSEKELKIKAVTAGDLVQ